MPRVAQVHPAPPAEAAAASEDSVRVLITPPQEVDEVLEALRFHVRHARFRGLSLEQLFRHFSRCDSALIVLNYAQRCSSLLTAARFCSRFAPRLPQVADRAGHAGPHRSVLRDHAGAAAPQPAGPVSSRAICRCV